jgi:hypothetical protein
VWSRFLSNILLQLQLYKPIKSIVALERLASEVETGSIDKRKENCDKDLNKS